MNENEPPQDSTCDEQIPNNVRHLSSWESASMNVIGELTESIVGLYPAEQSTIEGWMELTADSNPRVRAYARQMLYLAVDDGRMPEIIARLIIVASDNE